jgi:hypothetical protein
VKKLLAGTAIIAAMAGAPLTPAKAEITTQTLAYTFVFALAGTAAGAILVPYAAPAAAPVVAGAYSATATAVNSAATGLGNLVLVEPRMTGAIFGMGAGLLSGLYLYSE